MIMAGNKPDDHITHSITHPTEVSLEQTEEGADAALSIKYVDGTTAILTCPRRRFTGNGGCRGDLIVRAAPKRHLCISVALQLSRRR
jgi:hypothetical protein